MIAREKLVGAAAPEIVSSAGIEMTARVFTPKRRFGLRPKTSELGAFSGLTQGDFVATRRTEPTAASSTIGGTEPCLAMTEEVESEITVQDKGVLDEGLLAKRSINSMISERRSDGSLRKAFNSRRLWTVSLDGAPSFFCSSAT